MRLPRDLTGAELVRRLAKLGYRQTRQTGSHVRLSCEALHQHHNRSPARPAAHWHSCRHSRRRGRSAENRARRIAGTAVRLTAPPFNGAPDTQYAVCNDAPQLSPFGERHAARGRGAGKIAPAHMSGRGLKRLACCQQLTVNKRAVRMNR